MKRLLASLVREYQIPPLPAGKFRLEGGLVADSMPACSGKTSLDIVKEWIPA